MQLTADAGTIEHAVRAFITSNYLFGDESRPIGRHESLLELGTVDSMGVLELVAFLEQTFRIRVENRDLVPENLDTIANVSAYVLSKLA